MLWVNSLGVAVVFESPYESVVLGVAESPILLLFCVTHTVCPFDI